MVKDRILEEFKRLNCIKDWTSLVYYVDFCLTHHEPIKIPSTTSSHHILPRANTLPFKQFEDLKKNPWNLAELSYYNHYRAHYLLTLAVDHIAVVHSFVAMHNTDKKLGRLQHDQLIDQETYIHIFRNRNQKISERRKELVCVNGEVMTKAKLQNLTRVLSPEATNKLSNIMKGENNIVNKPGVVDKIRLTKSTTLIEGKNLDQISSERAAQTMSKVIITASGEETTIYKLAATKQSQTLNKPFIDKLGNETTLATEYGKQRSLRMRSQGKWYLVKNVFDPSMCQKLSAMEVRTISPGLEKCTKDNYLGKSKFGQNILTKRGKATLIGLYVERCE